MSGKIAPKYLRSLKLKSAAEAVHDFLHTQKGADIKLAMARLWQMWGMVMGPELAHLAKPLGERSRVLIIGAEDNMLLQDLTFMIPEILERANAFMDKQYFYKVQLELLQQRTPLYPYKQPEMQSATMPAQHRPRPQNLGELQGKLDPNSPVARCYEEYIRSFESETK